MISSIIKGRKQNDAPLVLCIDANEKVGSRCTTSIGSLNANKENSNGRMLHAMLEQAKLFLPATRTDMHTGPGWTWTQGAKLKKNAAEEIAGKSKKHRIDYIALPLTWEASKPTSYVEYSFGDSNSNPDHELLVTEFELETWQSSEQRCRQTKVGRDKAQRYSGCEHGKKRHLTLGKNDMEHTDAPPRGRTRQSTTWYPQMVLPGQAAPEKKGFHNRRNVGHDAEQSHGQG